MTIPAPAGSAEGGPSGVARDGPPVPAVVGLLLAAGSGRRFGAPKALVPYRGELLIERAHRLLMEAGMPTVVVLGAAAEQVRREAALPEAVITVNPEHAEGMGTSLRCGLQAVARSYPEATAALVMLVDMPWLSTAALLRLRQAAERGGAVGQPRRSPERVLLQASYDGVPGHPVVLGRAHHAGVLAAAGGDTGAREYLRAHRHSLQWVACEDVASGADADTPQQLGQ